MNMQGLNSAVGACSMKWRDGFVYQDQWITLCLFFTKQKVFGVTQLWGELLSCRWAVREAEPPRAGIRFCSPSVQVCVAQDRHGRTGLCPILGLHRASCHNWGPIWHQDLRDRQLSRQRSFFPLQISFIRALSTCQVPILEMESQQKSQPQAGPAGNHHLACLRWFFHPFISSTLLRGSVEIVIQLEQCL